MEQLVVSANTARQMLGISPNKMKELLDTGEIIAYKSGSAWKIPVRALEEYVLARARRETNERKKRKA